MVLGRGFGAGLGLSEIYRGPENWKGVGSEWDMVTDWMHEHTFLIRNIDSTFVLKKKGNSKMVI